MVAQERKLTLLPEIYSPADWETFILFSISIAPSTIFVAPRADRRRRSCRRRWSERGDAEHRTPLSAKRNGQFYANRRLRFTITLSLFPLSHHYPKPLFTRLLLGLFQIPFPTPVLFLGCSNIYINKSCSTFLQ